MLRDEVLNELRRLCPPGKTIYTILRNISRSGMTRRISAVVIHGGEPMQLDWLICKIGLFSLSNKHEGMIVRGCGMDMGLHVVYALGRTLYPQADGDGGYALKHAWL
jgi:hypothetical protein